MVSLTDDLDMVLKICIIGFDIQHILDFLLKHYNGLFKFELKKDNDR